MARDEIKLDLDLTEANALLRQMIDRGTDLTPVMGEIAADLLDASDTAFEQQRDPSTGVPWADLAEATKAKRRKEGTWPGAILNIRGGSGLFGSRQVDHGRDFAEIGSNKVYAAIHQLGGKAGRGRRVTIPARPFLGISDADRQAIARRILDFIAE